MDIPETRGNKIKYNFDKIPIGGYIHLDKEESEKIQSIRKCAKKRGFKMAFRSLPGEPVRMYRKE